MVKVPRSQEIALYSLHRLFVVVQSNLLKKLELLYPPSIASHKLKNKVFSPLQIVQI